MDEKVCIYCGSEGDDPHIGDCPVRLKQEILRFKVSSLKCMARINELTKEVERLNELLQSCSNAKD
jgi:hypothetical protein